MNGKPLPLDAPEMKAFTTYIAFLSQGVPVGAQIEGAAVLQSAVPNRRDDVAAGSVVYAAKCAACHGADGMGKRTSHRANGATPRATPSRRCGARTASTTGPA